MSDGFETQLLRGLARLLAAAGHGTWRETGAYQASETAICLDVFPATPDQVISLTAYPVDDDPALSDSTIAIQVRTRAGDPNTVRDLDSAIFTSLHGRHGFTTPADGAAGIRVVQCLRHSGVGLGMDESGRWGRSSNYYLDVHRPSTFRQ